MIKPLIIIPARAGSKGIKNKNFRRLPDGSTCVGRAIAIAKQLHPAHIIVSTDHRTWREPEGVIKHLRAPELAKDDTPMADVVADVLQAYPGPADQPVVLLQPTVPLRTVQTVQKCLSAWRRKDGRSMATISRIPARYCRPVTWPMFTACLELPARRQTAVIQSIATGDAYVFTRETGWPILWHPVLVPESLNLDTPQDMRELLRRISSRRGHSSTRPRGR